MKIFSSRPAFTKDSPRQRAVLSLLISLLIVIVTFPVFPLTTAPGIDPPLAWIFNYFADGKWQLGKDIIFPHGPLAFLMYPMPENLISAIVFYFIIRFIFSWTIFKLCYHSGYKGFIIPALCAFLLLGFNDILLNLIGLAVIAGQIYFLSRQTPWLILLAVVTVISVYIKAFAGIVCLAVATTVFVLLLIEVMQKREKASVLSLPILFIVLIPLPWIFIYQTGSGFLRFVQGNFLLAGDNSAAVALYPYNNWFLLVTGLICIIILALMHLRDKPARWFILTTAPAVFAVWRYGIARQDYLHAGTWFLFLLMLSVIFALIMTRKKMVTIAILGIGLLAFFINSRNAFYYEPYKFSFRGFDFLTKVVFNHNDLINSSRKATDKALQQNRLDEVIRKMIGNATADVYPWDQTYIPANKLNWQPRPVFQSYASYVPALDELNEAHFRSGKAPGFLLWELHKTTNDLFAGTMESIDGRLLLNDEPRTLIALLENYEFSGIYAGNKPVFLLKKKQKPSGVHIESENRIIAGWDRWIDVPQMKGDILRIKAEIQRNLTGNLRSLVYKDQPYYIYYRLANSETRFYRIVPANAATGIWVNPFVMDPGKISGISEVTKIMFRCPDHRLVLPEIALEWEHLSFDEHVFSSALIPRKEVRDTADIVITESFFNMEEQAARWKIPGSNRWSSFGYSGKRSADIQPGMYSPTFEIKVAELFPPGSDSVLLIRAAAWTYTTGRIKAELVISIDVNGESILWKGVPVDNFQIARNTWNYVYNFSEISASAIRSKEAVLKVYLWNSGTEPFLADEMMVRISGIR